MLKEPKQKAYRGHYANFHYLPDPVTGELVDPWEWCYQFAQHQTFNNPEGKKMTTAEAISWAIMQVRNNKEHNKDPKKRLKLYAPPGVKHKSEK